MDIQKLRAFVDLTKTMSYTETAERLFTTQATISKQIKSLEKELEVQLFSREHRTIEITEAGKVILPYANEIIQKNQQMLSKLKENQQNQSVELTIKAIPSITKYKALGLISEFHQAHPEINLHLSEAESYELVPALRNNEADVIFMRTFNINHSEFESVIGELDKFVVVVPKNNHLAKQTSLTVSDLQAESFLMLGKETNLFEPIMKMIRAANFIPKVTYEGRRIDLVMELVNKGMGVSIVMNQTVDLKEYPNVVKIPLSPEMVSQLAFVRRKENNSAACDQFWQFFQARQNIYID